MLCFVIRHFSLTSLLKARMLDSLANILVKSDNFET